MDEAIIQALHTRNRAIIDAVIAKAEKTCPGALDLIAVAGSFASSDFYEKSDLDLLIIINDDSGYQLAKCFILGDVGHDIYCQTWARLEHTAGYPDPHINKLLDAEIVYCRCDTVRERYLQLGADLRRKLERPLDTDDLRVIRGHMNDAVQAYGRLCLEEAPARCRCLAADVLYRIEYAIYMLNKAYIRHGIRGIPKEICSLPLLPRDFADHYHALIAEETVDGIRRELGWLIRQTESWIAEQEALLASKTPLTPDALRGTYEEIFSNWRNKMHRAANESNAYLSWMTAASCQAFYDFMANTYRISRTELFSGDLPRDLQDAAERFDAAMAHYKENYTNTGTEVCRYDNIDAFVTDYLK